MLSKARESKRPKEQGRMKLNEHTRTYTNRKKALGIQVPSQKVFGVGLEGPSAF